MCDSNEAVYNRRFGMCEKLGTVEWWRWSSIASGSGLVTRQEKTGYLYVSKVDTVAIRGRFLMKWNNVVVEYLKEGNGVE